MKKVAVAALVVLLLLGLGGLAAFWWWNGSIESFAQTPFGSAQEKVVEIAPGARMKDVAAELARAGVVSEQRRFEWLARRLKRDRQVKAGEYSFAGELLPEKVLETIALGKVKLYPCTVPEGLRLDEIATLLEGCRYGSADELLKLARDETFARKAGIKGSTLEGYLFPDTYSFPKNPKPETVLHKMVDRFFEELKKAQARKRPGITLDVHETATLASIVEKETGAPEERPRIACVFHNRLKKRMRLETDPTVIYAMLRNARGRPAGDVTSARAIAAGHRDLDDPYNTYKHRGLPPGPIASPGAAALQAALNPAECDDLFFVACGGGTHVFCPDYDCHLRNVDRCQRGKP